MAKTEVTARRRLFWPIVLLLISVLPTLYWDSLIHEIGVDVSSQTIKIAKYSIATISWLSVAWLAIRLIDVVIWDGLVAPRLGGTVPRLLKDVVAAVIFITDHDDRVAAV